MKQHPVLGYLIVSAIPSLAETLPGIRHHHERWDGRGYPDQLAGENIPLLGRLMAVPDAFSAITTDRPYRKGCPRPRRQAAARGRRHPVRSGDGGGLRPCAGRRGTDAGRERRGSAAGLGGLTPSPPRRPATPAPNAIARQRARRDQQVDGQPPRPEPGAQRPYLNPERGPENGDPRADGQTDRRRHSPPLPALLVSVERHHCGVKAPSPAPPPPPETAEEDDREMAPAKSDVAPGRPPPASSIQASRNATQRLEETDAPVTRDRLVRFFRVVSGRWVQSRRVVDRMASRCFPCRCSASPRSCPCSRQQSGRAQSARR